MLLHKTPKEKRGWLINRAKHLDYNRLKVIVRHYSCVFILLFGCWQLASEPASRVSAEATYESAWEVNCDVPDLCHATGLDTPFRQIAISPTVSSIGISATKVARAIPNHSGHGDKLFELWVCLGNITLLLLLLLFTMMEWFIECWRLWWAWRHGVTSIN